MGSLNLELIPDTDNPAQNVVNRCLESAHIPEPTLKHLHYIDAAVVLSALAAVVPVMTHQR